MDNLNRVTFLNHSSLLVRSPETAILCDPWFRGTAFNNGWRLLAENTHELDQIRCDHIWISHEHPDHFSIPTLSGLTSPRHFLYQQTADRKVHDYLTAKGHTVQELPDAAAVPIGDITLTTFVCDGYDSASLFEFPNGDSFLNINDSRVELGGVLEKIQQQTPKQLDAIALQFSYANWAGNAGDDQIPQHQQDLVLERIIHVYQALQPAKVILFASFVYYSHEENFHWNGKFWLPYVVDTLKSHGIDVIVPAPNHTFTFGELREASFDDRNAEAIAFWKQQADAAEIRDRTRPVILKELQDGYNTFFDRLWTANRMEAARTSRNQDFRLRVHLTDLGQTVSLSLFQKRFAVEPDSPDDAADASVSSETLQFLFKNNFGRGTTTVNARIQFHYETAHRFFFFFFVPYANNIGRYYRDKALTAEDLASVGKTSVLLSICQFHAGAVEAFHHDLALFNPANSNPAQITPAETGTLVAEAVR